MNILFGTVVYESAYQYLSDFLNSVSSQTFKDFKLLIINDGIESAKLSAALKQLTIPFEVIGYGEQLSRVELRIRLLLEAKERDSDLLIIGDSDDIFSDDRVEKVVCAAKAGKNYDFFYNNIVTFDHSEVFPALPESVDSISGIADYNFLGLSNTAIRMSAVPASEINTFRECMNLIFDWYLHSRLLISGHKGLLVNSAVTYYRYHENNTVGNQDNDSEIIKKEIEIKTSHYESLRDRSEIMRNRYNSYVSGHYRPVSAASPRFWWGYTTGG